MPFLAACSLGGWNASTGLVTTSDPGDGTALFFLGVLVALGSGAFLVACVQDRTSRAAPCGVLVVAGTYLIPVLCGRAGPWSAGTMGAGLLGLAWLTQVDVRRQRRLPTHTLEWTWRSLAGVLAVSVVLDIAVGLIGRRTGDYRLTTLAVLVAGVATTALLALCALLVEGGRGRPL